MMIVWPGIQASLHDDSVAWDPGYIAFSEKSVATVSLMVFI